MMSAPTPARPASADAVSKGTAPANTPEPSREGGGFTDLLGALLSGPAPADGAAAEVTAAVLDGGDEDSDVEFLDPDELLAALGLPLPSVPVAPASLKSADTLARATGQLPAAAAARMTANRDLLLGMVADALKTEAGLPTAGDGPSLTEPRTGEPGAGTGLNAWASAAQRVAAGQDGAAVTTEATLREPVGGQRWKDELGVQLTLMAAQGKQSGSLRLSPEHLGPLEIQITVNDDKTTNVQFGAQHADTRAALQDALPRLREMFTAAGLQLGDAGVSGEAPRQRAEEAGGAAALAEGRGDGEPSHPDGRVRSITHSGLLDTYA